MKNVLTFIAIIFSLNCVGQTYPQSDFTETPMPNFMSPGWYKLDTPMNKLFSVAIIDGQLQISKIARSKVYSVDEFPTTEGKLLIFRMFEFGSGLYYRPNDERKEIFVNGRPGIVNKYLENYDWMLGNFSEIKEQIHKRNFMVFLPSEFFSGLVPFKDGWLFAQGQMNMKGKHGEVNMLKMQKDTLTVSHIADIEDSRPVAVGFYKDKIFVGTENAFYHVNGNKAEKITDMAFWQMIGPTSIAALDDEIIYAGINCGYVKINIVTKEVKLFVYNH